MFGIRLPNIVFLNKNEESTGKSTITYTSTGYYEIFSPTYYNYYPTADDIVPKKYTEEEEIFDEKDTISGIKMITRKQDKSFYWKMRKELKKIRNEMKEWDPVYYAEQREKLYVKYRSREFKITNKIYLYTRFDYRINKVLQNPKANKGTMHIYLRKIENIERLKKKYSKEAYDNECLVFFKVKNDHLLVHVFSYKYFGFKSMDEALHGVYKKHYGGFYVPNKYMIKMIKAIKVEQGDPGIIVL